MNLDLFSGLLGWSRRHAVSEITLLGGEPSLHPEFVDMVVLGHQRGMQVRVVTNGASSFRRALKLGLIDRHNLSRVAVSLDSVDEKVQDQLRGRGAWRDAMETIEILRKQQVLFDINATAVRTTLDGLDALIDFGCQADCRRINIHWPSIMGIGSDQPLWQIPDKQAWRVLTREIESRVELRPDFFVEIERGFLDEEQAFTACALSDFSNLQVLPDGRAYRCGLLVDQYHMASLMMEGENLLVTRPNQGEELVRSSMTSSCDRCPVITTESRHACIFDKISSAHG